jgi:hypothetical protein
MRPERFVIINNRTANVALIRKLLSSLDYDSSRIWPGDDTTVVTSWQSAFDRLVKLKPQGFDPSASECFLLLDLALDTNDKQYEEGIGQIHTRADNLEPYVCVLFTLWSSPARKRLFGTIADGVIDATSFGQSVTGQVDSGRSARILDYHLQSAVEAWTKRTGRRPSVPRENHLITDSPGARALNAALSQQGINYLIQAEAKLWSHVSVIALTGGFSGAHLLRIDGSDHNSPRSVVCKVVSRDRTPLDREMKRVREAMRSYQNSLGPPPAYLNSAPKEIGDGDAWYIVQATVPGETLETIIGDGENVMEKELAIVLEYVKRFATALDPEWVSHRSMLPALKMEEQDIERFETTSKWLATLAARARRDLYLSDPLMEKDSIDRFAKVIREWNTAVSMFNPAPHLEQHGDFNVRNIFVSNGNVQLIDFARYGPWPVGYDLTRLELQLLLRGADASTGEDEFPHSLPAWSRLWNAVRAADPDRRGPVDVEPRHRRLLQILDDIARIRRDAMNKLLPNVGEERRQQLISVQRTFDAVRICSYQDASTFKHLWFLQISIHAALDAGFALEAA